MKGDVMLSTSMTQNKDAPCFMVLLGTGDFYSLLFRKLMPGQVNV